MRGVYLAWQTPTGIAFLLSKKILKEKVFIFGLTRLEGSLSYSRAPSWDPYMLVDSFVFLPPLYGVC